MSEFTDREMKLQERLSQRIDRAERPLDELTRRLVEAHELSPIVHRHGDAALPDLGTVREILGGLFEMISPGYGRRQELDLHDASYHLGYHASELRRRLAEQVARDLRFSTPQSLRDQTDFQSAAAKLIDRFADFIPDLVGQLEQDVIAASANDPSAKSLELILLCFPGVRAIRVYRIANLLHRLGLTLIPRMMTEIAHADTGIDIHPGAAIGSHFFIDHGTGTTIGETAVIGNRVVLFQGVTIGARKFAVDAHGHVLHNSTKRHPTLEDDVIVYANATILGGDTVIGSKTVIGSSTWINKSIPPGMIVTIEEPKQRHAENRLLIKVEVEFSEATELSDHDAFQLYIDNLTRIFDL